MELTTDPKALAPERSTLLQAIFGKTKRSPFSWGVAQAQENRLFCYLQDQHKDFWNRDLLRTDGCAFENPYEQTIVDIAQAAYEGSQYHGEKKIAVDPSLLFLLQHVELPLWCATRNFQLDQSGKEVVSRFEAFIAESLDEDGWPLGSVADRFELFIASLCRCHKLLDVLGYQLAPDTENQLVGLTHYIARMMRADDSLLLSGDQQGIQCNAFKKMIAALWSNHDLYPLKLKKSNVSQLRLPAASSVSEWGQVGVLRSGWLRKDCKIGFRFDERRIHLDVDHGRTLIAGECTPRLLLDEKPVEIASEIGVACFHRFEQGEYIELEVEFESATLSRQILLLGEDQLLFLNDAVVCQSEGVIDYTCPYPIHPDLEIVRESETNEFYLCSGAEYSLVLPLFLPEWKSAGGKEAIQFEDGHLQVKNVAQGSGLSTAMVIDLNRKRSVKPRTWRRLTIAEQMQVVREDVAVAYRVQIDVHQWLFYRTIRPSANRTFIGQNFADDFFVGKMDLEGNFESWLEIE